MKYLIKKVEEAKTVLEHFNHFHDGFIKSLKVISNNKFIHELPWEKAKTYTNIEDYLDATSLTLDRKTGVFLQIYHYNYDFPNRLPNNCINIYLSDCEIIDPSIFQYSGSSILDLTIDSSDNGKLSLHFDLEILSKGYYQREKLEAFKASIIYISEK